MFDWPPSQVSLVGAEWGRANAVLGALWGKKVVDCLYYLSPGLPGPLCRDRVATTYTQIHTHTHAPTQTYSHARAHTHIRSHTHTHKHTHTHTLTHQD